MSNHTPGPWIAKKDGVYLDTPWSIDHEDGHDASWSAISMPTGRTLALVVNDDSNRPMDFQSEEMHANANLIAAAPDLLDALEGMVSLFPTGVDDEGSGIGFNDNLKAKYRASIKAIACARGES